MNMDETTISRGLNFLIHDTNRTDMCDKKVKQQLKDAADYIEEAIDLY